MRRDLPGQRAGGNSVFYQLRNYCIRTSTGPHIVTVNREKMKSSID